MYIKLKVKAETGEHVFEFKDVSQVLVGRSNAQIVLDDDRCSRAHCLLMEATDGELHVRDLDSSNGTYFQDKKITEATLKEGDKIRIGRTSISIVSFGNSARSSSKDRTGKTNPDLINDWSDMLRAMPAKNVENFLDYIDPDKKKKSVRLQDLERKKKQKKAK